MPRAVFTIQPGYADMVLDELLYRSQKQAVLGAVRRFRSLPAVAVHDDTDPGKHHVVRFGSGIEV